MNSIHIMNEDKRKLYFNILQVGAGANGGQFFRSLCQDIATHFISFNNNPGNDQVQFGMNLTICDRDVYEPKNLANQLCTQEDMDEYKVIALAERYADVYDLSVKTVTEYIKDFSMLDQFLKAPSLDEAYQHVYVLVGMIDNNKTRQLFHDYFYSEEVDNLIWIDTGVTGVEMQSEYSDEEEANIRESGFSGQAVVGFKYNGHVILEPVTDMFPNILDDAATHFPDESCGEVIINNPQRSSTNKMAALIANNIMNNLFHSQRIFNHVLNFNAQLCASGGRTSFIKDYQLQKWEEVKQYTKREGMDYGTS
ncbi:thiamine biosynthesis protein ThiF [Pontibacillus yanchengensis]|uniref:Thiamine biosynthesis protein ThiF n=2 Tax=Pontibacillus yanchengensis TaxID=462910 RepID=A0ACC7VKY9_9BACI|nr:ThiF family adenylyltransferase [Pontibacillus yanchengensis]MYL35446.1 thiamine biosynthesis protein ThiF [Pontibacillus yanchengensis]MYL55646.1 thiamine biosynthesis protein ThiF [Pontibacillus yanchengensis]